MVVLTIELYKILGPKYLSLKTMTAVRLKPLRCPIQEQRTGGKAGLNPLHM